MTAADSRPDPRLASSWCFEGIAHDHDACGNQWNNYNAADVEAAVRWIDDHPRPAEQNAGGAVTEQTRHTTASAVVVDRGTASVLLVLHKKMGVWVFPGGHVDPDEAPHETAVREVREETGIEPVLFTPAAPARLPGMVRHPAPWVVAEIPAPGHPADGEWPAEPPHSHIDLLYVATADRAAALVGQDDEVGGVQWVPVTELGGWNVRGEVPQLAAAAYAQVAAAAATRIDTGAFATQSAVNLALHVAQHRHTDRPVTGADVHAELQALGYAVVPTPVHPEDPWYGDPAFHSPQDLLAAMLGWLDWKGWLGGVDDIDDTVDLFAEERRRGRARAAVD